MERQRHIMEPVTLRTGRGWMEPVASGEDAPVSPLSALWIAALYLAVFLFIVLSLNAPTR